MTRAFRGRGTRNGGSKVGGKVGGEWVVQPSLGQRGTGITINPLAAKSSRTLPTHRSEPALSKSPSFSFPPLSPVPAGRRSLFHILHLLIVIFMCIFFGDKW